MDNTEYLCCLYISEKHAKNPADVPEKNISKDAHYKAKELVEEVH
jgi:hypothetical protein